MTEYTNSISMGGSEQEELMRIRNTKYVKPNEEGFFNKLKNFMSLDPADSALVKNSRKS